MADSNLIATIFVGLLFSLFLNMGIVLQTQGLSVNIVVASTGLILLLVAVGDMLARYRIIRVDAELEKGKPQEAMIDVPTSAAIRE